MSDSSEETPPTMNYAGGPTPVVEPTSHGATPVAAPRQVTPTVARRAWSEPAVRVWWLMAGVLLTLAIGVTAYQLKTRHDQVRLLESGRVVHTTVVGGAGFRYIEGQVIDAGQEVRLRYHQDGGNDVDLIGTLDVDSKIGKPVDVRIDPADPTVWTARTSAPSVVNPLLIGLALLPVAVAVGLVAWFRRAKVLRTYKTGPAVVAVVSDKRVAPVAPMSYSVRCSYATGSDRRLFTVHVPGRFGTVRKGDRLWVLTPVRGQGAVAAAWFEEGQ